MNNDIDEIRILEGNGGACVGSFVELPIGRPQPPAQLAEFVPVRCEPGAPALGIEVKLVPETMLLRWVRWPERSGNVWEDRVAVR